MDINSISQNNTVRLNYVDNFNNNYGNIHNIELNTLNIIPNISNSNKKHISKLSINTDIKSHNNINYKSYSCKNYNYSNLLKDHGSEFLNIFFNKEKKINRFNSDMITDKPAENKINVSEENKNNWRYLFTNKI